MAKVSMPLGGIEARGKIADTFVFFPWKGINAVRSYVIPANPNTSAQQTVRSRFSDAVDWFHARAYNARDLEALRRLAGTQAKPMTYFNVVVKKYCEIDEAGDTIVPCDADATSEGSSSGQIDFQVDATTGKTMKVKYGTSPTYLPNTSAAMSDDVGEYTLTVSSLDAGALYYYRYICETAGNEAISGVYSQKAKA